MLIQQEFFKIPHRTLTHQLMNALNYSSIILQFLHLGYMHQSCNISDFTVFVTLYYKLNK